MPLPPPRILIVQHHKENPKKCTVTAIRERPDVEVKVLRPGPSAYPPLPVEGGILLAVNAPILRQEDRELLAEPGQCLVLVDANWVKVSRILRAIEPRGPLEHRTLPAGFLTAYPRRSKVFEDPSGGLATVEAIVAALAVLGMPDMSFLDGYVWKDRFLELNRALLMRPDDSGCTDSAAPLE